VCFVRIYVFHGESSSRCVTDVRTGGSAGGEGWPPPQGAGAKGYPEGYAFEHDGLGGATPSV
jgi:hypothetical protein